jgi:hypothetical protein
MDEVVVEDKRWLTVADLVIYPCGKGSSWFRSLARQRTRRVFLTRPPASRISLAFATEVSRDTPFFEERALSAKLLHSPTAKTFERKVGAVPRRPRRPGSSDLIILMDNLRRRQSPSAPRMRSHHDMQFLPENAGDLLNSKPFLCSKFFFRKGL